MIMSRPFDIVQYGAFNVHTLCSAAVLSLSFHSALKEQAPMTGVLREKSYSLGVSVASDICISICICCFFVFIFAFLLKNHRDPDQGRMR